MRRITATELGKQLSDVLNRVYYRHERVLVERGGKPVCEIGPITEVTDFKLADLVELLHTVPETDKAFGDAVRAGVAEQGAFEGTEWPRSSTRAS